MEEGMQYLCMVHVDGSLMAKLTPAEDKDLTRRSLAYDEELQKSGHFLAASALQGPDTATVVRVRNGKVSMTDGPHVETKEHLGGFILIEARDLNEALAVAQKIPMASFGSIEIRPEYPLEARRPA
jgi:hypothetical protein